MTASTMPAPDVICLRPEADFHEVGVVPPEDLRVVYRGQDEVGADELGTVRALLLPSVGPSLPREWLTEPSRLELVQFTGAGVDRAGDLTECRDGMVVANVPAANAREVAEYVLFAAGGLLRGLALADREVRAGRYVDVRGRLTPAVVHSLHSRTVGIVGLGNIGLAVARLMLAVGARAAYSDPNPSQENAGEAATLGVQRLDLDQLVATCDVITLHVPLVAATRGLIDDARLRSMRPDAILINAARGGIVDEAALALALTEGRLAGAAVDVYEREPPGEESPLLGLPGAAKDRLLLTPHIGGVAYEAARTLYAEAWANVSRALLEGAPVQHRVWPRILPGEGS
ncbi:MAG TPA: NAD(P)-dependent oxidoreductase [Solirubrobacteraceae bacterium]|nr:NAD(P)-dependent oxidoreductase [Solirubrobacteraceae bacterium]